MTPLQTAATALIDAMSKTDFTCRLGEQLDALEKALEAEQAVEPVLFIDASTLAMNAAHVGAWKPGHELEGNLPLYLHPPAQSQPVATVQCVRGVTIGYLDVMQPVGTKLYTHPAQQVAAPMTEAQIFACDPVPHEMFDQQRIDFARAVEAHHKIGSKPDVRIPTSETKVRPQNCGTGHCSCIECPYPKADWSAA
jgi:hypothetical protein